MDVRCTTNEPKAKQYISITLPFTVAVGTYTKNSRFFSFND